MRPAAQHVGGGAYFSNGIVNDCEPKPDDEDGVLDVIVLAVIERTLEIGQALELRSRQ